MRISNFSSPKRNKGTLHFSITAMQLIKKGDIKVDENKTSNFCITVVQNIEGKGNYYNVDAGNELLNYKS